jgi:DNA-binding transcriptional MerR regulator
MPPAELPNRSLFKAPEVCEIAQLQPYVLRSWEAEFPDLGVTRAGSAGRVYRRGDVERVLRLKHLLFVEGLTLAGARRRLEEERVPLPAMDETVEEPPSRAASQSGDKVLRQKLTSVKQGLQSLLQLLEGRGAKPGTFELRAEPLPNAKKGNGKAPKPQSKPAAGKSKNGGAARSSR